MLKKSPLKRIARPFARRKTSAIQGRRPGLKRVKDSKTLTVQVVLRRIAKLKSAKEFEGYQARGHYVGLLSDMGRQNRISEKEKPAVLRTLRTVLFADRKWEVRAQAAHAMGELFGQIRNPFGRTVFDCFVKALNTGGDERLAVAFALDRVAIPLYKTAFFDFSGKVRPEFKHLLKDPTITIEKLEAEAAEKWGYGRPEEFS